MNLHRRKPRLRFAAVIIGSVLVGGTARADIETQRDLFRQVYADVERGSWAVVEALPQDEQRLLADYVLWPDLRATYFRAVLKRADHAQIEQFLARHGTLRPARELRYRYALHLAEAGHFEDFLRLYRQYYDDIDNARLDCLALQSELAGGVGATFAPRAAELWTVAGSQVDECDPVFAYLHDRNLLTRSDYERRFELAMAARAFSRARWLARSIDQQHVDIAESWLAVHNNPRGYLSRHLDTASDAETRKRLVYALERLSYSDAAAAQAFWEALAGNHSFSTEQQARVSRHVALWAARDGVDGAYTLLATLDAGATTAEVFHWRARLSLAARNWQRLLADIDAMAIAERETEQWRYWRGIALDEMRRADEANAVLSQLAGERSYYGFLAADAVGSDYALVDSTTPPDEAVIASLAARPEFVRAGELFRVGLDSRGRSEWDAQVAELDRDTKLQAAILASRWGWHSRAIATAASAGHYDDLSLRYPLPFRESFLQHARDASISPAWAYGVARSESLFMRDVRSSAGAIGLMQLMPATGRRVARDLRLPYTGFDTLVDPQRNIQLGTGYLARMAARYGGNEVAATAAYNAGPRRVDAWLPDGAAVDARLWIESIPFDETRGYVRRVLAADTIFHWRMTGQVRRLTERLQAIQAPAAPVRAASN